MFRTTTTFVRAIALTFSITAIASTACTSAPVLTDKDTLLVADFSNSTGDKAWDDALKPVVGVLLQQTPFLTIAPDFRVQRTMRALQMPPDQPVAGENGRTLCGRVGAKAMVEGSIAGAGAATTLTLTVVDCGTGKTLAKQEIKGDQTTLIGALTEGVRLLRKDLGETSATLDKYNAPAAGATSNSLGALQAYGLGLRARAIGGDSAAIPYFQQAATQDPAFALAFAKLGVVAYNTGRLEESRQLAQKAYELRDKVTQYERLYIDWNYASRVKQDPKAVKASLEQLTTEYPRDFAARNNFGVYYNGTGEYEEALKQYKAASDIAPDEPGPMSNAAYVLMTIGRPAKCRSSAPDRDSAGSESRAGALDHRANRGPAAHSRVRKTRAQHGPARSDGDGRCEPGGMVGPFHRIRSDAARFCGARESIR